MADDYLWDRSGPPDPDVEALEHLLAPYGHGERAGRPPSPPPLPRQASPLPWPARLPTGVAPALAAAAVLLLAVTVAMVGPAPLDGTPAAAAPGWELSPLKGRPLVASTPVDGPERVLPGTWIDTDADTAARLELPSVGRVIVAPASRVRVTRTAPGEQWLHLEHGTLDALIWAPPGEVVVSTPVATAVDLGCAYTLTLDRSGRGALEVTAGWVGLVHDGREAFIPAGALVQIHASGPGTPIVASASQALREAIVTFDTTRARDARASALDVILRESSPADALTLWHLLARATPEERAGLFDALAARVPPPDPVTRAGVIAGDRAMLDAWWAELGHGGRDWWQLWVREWRDGRLR